MLVVMVVTTMSMAAVTLVFVAAMRHVDDFRCVLVKEQPIFSESETGSYYKVPEDEVEVKVKVGAKLEIYIR